MVPHHQSRSDGIRAIFQNETKTRSNGKVAYKDKQSKWDARSRLGVAAGCRMKNLPPPEGAEEPETTILPEQQRRIKIDSIERITGFRKVLARTLAFTIANREIIAEEVIEAEKERVRGSGTIAPCSSAANIRSQRQG